MMHKKPNQNLCSSITFNANTLYYFVKTKILNNSLKINFNKLKTKYALKQHELEVDESKEGVRRGGAGILIIKDGGLV